jgi:hypothetical protein
MKKMTYGFAVETDKEIIRISMGDDDTHEVVITPYEVDTLVAMLQEAKDELLTHKPNATPRKHS